MSEGLVNKGNEERTYQWCHNKHQFLYRLRQARNRGYPVRDNLRALNACIEKAGFMALRICMTCYEPKYDI